MRRIRPARFRPARIQLAIVALCLWTGVAIAGPWLATWPWQAQDRQAVLQAPALHPRPDAHGKRHWLGTDPEGRDVYSRLLDGARYSLLLYLGMAVPPLVLGLGIGLVSALSPAADGLFRWLGEVARSLPWVFVLIAVRAALPLDATTRQLVMALIGLFTLASWPVPAWVFRGAAKDLLQRDFLAAARVTGAGNWRLLICHVWPNLRPLAAVWLALLVAAAALAEVGLAMVGLGLPQPLPTWGNMLAPLKDIFLMQDWWLYAPLLCLIPLLTCLNLHAGSRARQSRG